MLMLGRPVLFLLPLVVLGVTRLAIEVSARMLPLPLAWVPAFAAYYLVIEAGVLWARRYLAVPPPHLGRLWPVPPMRLLLPAIVLSATLTLVFFLNNVRVVPLGILVLVLLYAVLTPYFEEVFWRCLLDALPARPAIRSLYSAFFFGFSHYFLWGAYWLAQPPRRWIAAALSIFMMGLLWSWFYRRDGRLLYPILSHGMVDVFNLSVALFSGVRLVTV